MPELVILAAVWVGSAAAMTVREARKGSREIAGMAVVFAILGPFAPLGPCAGGDRRAGCEGAIVPAL